MRTIVVTRSDYEAIASQKKEALSQLVKVPHLVSNHRVRTITSNAHTFLAFNENGAPSKLVPPIVRGSIVGICEPVIWDDEIGNVYVWDFPEGQCPASGRLRTGWMKSEHCRLVIYTENVKAVRLSDFTDEMALKEGAWLDDDGTFKMIGGEGYCSSQPTAAGAFVEAFIKKVGLAPKDYWLWHYEFKVINNLTKTHLTHDEWQNAFA